MMATAIQNNGIESLANGNINHVKVNEEHVESSDITTNSSTAGEISSEAEPPEIDIVINNVVCSFSVRCHLNLRQIALNGANVEYRRENGVCLLCSQFTCRGEKGFEYLVARQIFWSPEKDGSHVFLASSSGSCLCWACRINFFLFTICPKHLQARG